MSKFISKNRRHRIYMRDGFKCYLCNRQVMAGKKRKAKRHNMPLATLDHLVAQSKGGKSTDDNLMTCCEACNLAKKNTALSKPKLAELRAEISRRTARMAKKDEAESLILGFVWFDVVGSLDRKQLKRLYKDVDSFLGF